MGLSLSTKSRLQSTERTGESEMRVIENHVEAQVHTGMTTAVNEEIGSLKGTDESLAKEQRYVFSCYAF